MMTEKSMYIGFYPDIFGDRMIEGRRNREPWNEILPVVNDMLLNSLRERVKSKPQSPEFLIQYDSFISLLKSHLDEIYFVYYTNADRSSTAECNAYLMHKLEMSIMKG